MAEKPLVYSDSGVNYDMMDPFKIACQNAALRTSKNVNRFNDFYQMEVEEVAESRGESAYEIEIRIPAYRAPHQQWAIFRIAHVIEGLGTKNEIADQMRQLQSKIDLAEEASKIFGRSFYKGIAIDNAAMVLNDLSTRAAFPLSFMLHVAAYPSDWFADKERGQDLINGTVEACNQAKCTWGGGESPTLRDIINPGHALISGSAVGLKFPHVGDFSEQYLEEGLRIILLGSSGPHANGITLLRTSLLERLPKGYETLLEDGQTYSEAILAPTIIYSDFIDALLFQRVQVNYASHISGHGWRKLMRPQREFTYVIDKIPQPQPIFRLVQQVSGMSHEQMYGDYNMGAGFALYVPARSVSTILNKAAAFGLTALDAGYVEKGPRRVIINPLGIEFADTSLHIR